MSTGTATAQEPMPCDALRKRFGRPPDKLGPRQLAGPYTGPLSNLVTFVRFLSGPTVFTVGLPSGPTVFTIARIMAGP